MMTKPHILVAEDEVGQAIVLQHILENADFEVSLAHTGQKALECIEVRAPDLLILDWMMPELSGLQLMQKLRKDDTYKTLPIIMLTARGAEKDILQSFATGADDFMIKPYIPSELLARVTGMLRRMRPEIMVEVIKVADVTLNLERKQVLRGDSVVNLGPTEFRLLHVFMAKPGKVYSREQLLDKAWGKNIYVEDRTVDVAMRRLRKALNLDGKRDLFRTVRGAGYAMDEPI